MERYSLIQVNDNEFVDGFDGELYETTTSREQAWRMRYKEANDRLVQVKKQFADAKVIKA